MTTLYPGIQIQSNPVRTLIYIDQPLTGHFTGPIQDGSDNHPNLSAVLTLSDQAPYIYITDTENF